MKHIFVFDPKAFYNQEWKLDVFLDTIGEYFRTQEKPDFSIQYSRYRRNALSIIQDEVEKAKPDDIIRVYAIGDDEVIFDCLNGVALFPDMQLAMIPYGGSNDFLKIFGEENLEGFRDIMTAINAETIPTDAIKWGINYSLNSCYIGMDSAISKRISDMKSNLGRRSFNAFSKTSSWITLFLMAFDKQIAAKEYKITIDDNDFSGQYCLIHVANGPYFSGKITGSAHASPDDGLLDVALIKSIHPLGILSSMKRYSKGKKPRNGLFVRGKKITVESESQMWIQLDNEYIQDTSITLNVAPHALNMVTVNNLSYPIASIQAR